MEVDLIYYASVGKKSKVLKLLKSGVAVDAMNRNRETSLFYAAKNGKLSTVKVLLKNGADPNRINRDGCSPVFIAAVNDQEWCLRMLLRQGGVWNPTQLLPHDVRSSGNECEVTQSEMAYQQPPLATKDNKDDVNETSENLEENNYEIVNAQTEFRKNSSQLGSKEISIQSPAQSVLSKDETRKKNETSFVKTFTDSVINIKNISVDFNTKIINVEKLFRLRQCQVFGERFTCKIYLERKTNDFEAYKEELNFVRSLRHPNIINPIYLSITAQNTKLLLLTESILSGNLYGVLTKGKQILSPTESLQIMQEMALACIFLHSDNIIHNFLNSSSIFLTDKWQVKLGNFEFCTRNSTPDATKRLHLVHLPYAAPEVIMKKPPSFYSDVYSYGCIVWEMFGGKRPWSWIPENDLIAIAHVNHNLRLPMQDTWPLIAQELIEKCLSTEPESRLKFDDVINLIRSDQPKEIHSTHSSPNCNCDGLARSDQVVFHRVDSIALAKSKVAFSEVNFMVPPNISQQGNGVKFSSSLSKELKRLDYRASSEMISSLAQSFPRKSCLKVVSETKVLPPVYTCHHVKMLEGCESVDRYKVLQHRDSMYQKIKAGAILNATDSLSETSSKHQRLAWRKESVTLEDLELLLRELHSRGETEQTIKTTINEFFQSNGDIDTRFKPCSSISETFKNKKNMDEICKQKLVADIFEKAEKQQKKKWAKTSTLADRDFLGYRKFSSLSHHLMQI